MRYLISFFILVAFTSAANVQPYDLPMDYSVEDLETLINAFDDPEALSILFSNREHAKYKRLLPTGIPLNIAAGRGNLAAVKVLI
jgi:hypothetical protein